MESIPECTQLIEELTRNKCIQMMITYCGNDFVDAETGKCNFTSEDFVAMLEYAQMLPEEIDWSEYGDDYWIKQDFQYRENRTLLAECEVSNVRYINDYINGYYGKGNGSYFVFDGTKKCRRGSGHYSKSRRGICK